MRRCQRLPEVTHPVDSTRPDSTHIKSHARASRGKTGRKSHGRPPSVLSGRRRLTSRQSGCVDSTVPPSSLTSHLSLLTFHFRPPAESVHAEVAFGFPRRNVLDVVEPLFALRGDEMFEQVLAERVSHQVVLLELVERLVQVAGQLV